MPNPTVEKLQEGVQIARENHVDFLLAVGGGSCCDYAKAVSVSVHCDEDPWEKYYIRFEEPDCEIVPVGCVLTMVGTGSEMNGGAVITNHDQKLKIGHVFGDAVMPKFAVLNPKFTFSLPKQQMVAGIYDIFNHICEQYFSGEDDNTSDYISEALMKSVIHSSRIAIQNPEDYEAKVEYHVGCNLGTEYACFQRKKYRLDGSYAWSGSRSIYGCNSRNDTFCGVTSLLSVYYALWS